MLWAIKNKIDAGNGLVNIINLSFEGANFPRLGTFTRTARIAVLFAKNVDTWNKVGQTEPIIGELNP